ncbi:MmcQ/YjbR family DNA-binding protein [Clostridium sp. AM58-1XD]|uniref:MmcQ/YjbR family DNA-binding protein n=1 Tax=Clostridium sp. AM58-1XD TaxID=2292307 RepID=UPI0026AFAD18
MEKKNIKQMKTKQDLIQYCLTLRDVYEDYPFRDQEWAVIRHKSSKKVFAWIYRRNGSVCINVKCDPEWVDFWRKAFSGVQPGYHLNKKYWNTVILDGSVPDGDIKRMISESYDLTKTK